MKYGFVKPVQTEKDYIFGASVIPDEILVSNGDWRPWKPSNEIQNVNGVETSACATFGTLNLIETYLRAKYGK